MSEVGGGLGLCTDLYELTMGAAFVDEGRADETVTFDLFVRSLPAARPYLVACGIRTALERVAAFTYGAEALAYLATLELFDNAFLDRLAALRFRGEIRAVAEGERVYAGEPLLSVTGPLLEAQLLETLLINAVGFETMVASKAAVVARACRGRRFVDFSARRDHGLDAAVHAARAAFVGGASATSFVEAGRRFAIPVAGTMAHSYVMAHGSEEAAFRAFLGRYGARAVLLVDTYDTADGVRRACAAMRDTGVLARGIRIDSGDLAALTVQAREILDAEGFPSVEILLSGDLDEHRIADILDRGAPADSFGVGTRLGTSADRPYLGIVYKLVEAGGLPRMKRSAGKETLPGRKQVWRRADHDVLALAGEPGPPGARPLLATVWSGDGPVGPPEPLAEARARAAAELAHDGPWPVHLSTSLDSLVHRLDAALMP